jgi:pyroglutamyl-peptidase
MGSAKLRLLLTSFGSFPGVPRNASEPFVGLLSESLRRTIEPALVESVALPTLWSSAPEQLDTALARHLPDVCVHFGVARSARGLVIEQTARNLAGQKPDAAGQLPASRTLVPGAPRIMQSPVEAAGLAKMGAHKAVPIVTSTSAGDYLCNAIFFHSLWRARRAHAPRLVSFVHLPVLIGHLGEASEPNCAPGVALEPMLHETFELVGRLLEQFRARALAPV